MDISDNIIYEKKDNTAWITFNRPEVRNAMNEAIRRDLGLVLQDCWDDDDIHVIVISGSGDKAFMSGADLEELSKQNYTERIKHKSGVSWAEALRLIPKPVIAAVNGLAFGGGFELALACDIIIAADNAEFAQREIKVGLIPGAGATQVLPRLIGEKKAKELIFTGRTITAQEALELGIVNDVVPYHELYKRVKVFIKDLLRNSPLILGIAKLAVNRSMETGLSIGMACERDYFNLCFSTEDHEEGIRAFLEKRKPVYKGR